MSQLAFRCYAKINLTLEVVRRRQDGYHDLASVVHTISLADDLHLEPGSGLSSRVDGLAIRPDDNLVTRAALRLASAADVAPNAGLHLVKRIPAAAGFGGGSSDAATTLVGLNRLWATRLGPAQLAAVAATLGSDVPFFLTGGAALMTGRGERLERLAPLRDQWLILVAPAHSLATKTPLLYAALEQADFSSGAASERAAARLRQRLALSEEHLCNAFTRPARGVFPGLAEAWTAAERACQRRFFLSGAGPALFAFALDREDAQRQQRKLDESGVAAFAARTVDTARDPVRFRHGRSSGTLSADPRALCLVVQW